MKSNFEITFLPETEISPELNRAIDVLDHLAFSSVDHHDPALDGIEWASHEWNGLGHIGGELVSQLCLLKREITVGQERVWVAGIGGVATHPHWQRHGLASQLMRAAADFIRHEMDVNFGLLICSETIRPFYEGLGWLMVADTLNFVQNNQPGTLKTCVMILKISADPFPQGVIDLRGLPW
jgi:nodulation protein A